MGKEGTSQREDDTAMSGTEEVQSSGSHCASPEDSRSRNCSARKSAELLNDGCLIALHARDPSRLHVSRQRVKGGGWILDTISGVTKRDPAAQFLVNFGSKDTIGLRSLAAGGKLLQINRKMEFVFASHSFDTWESWSLEGPLEQCRLVNCRNTQAVLDVRIEVLATVGEDGILRSLD